MNRLYRNMLLGVGSSLAIFPTSSYSQPKEGDGGFVRDARNLKGDFKQVGCDIQRTMDAYNGQSSYR